MIKSFRCRSTAAIFSGKNVTRWVNIRAVAERKLQMLNRATRLDDLRVPPKNRLEALRGDRDGRFSILINDQWRICFRFEAGNAVDIEIVDYH